MNVVVPVLLAICAGVGALMIVAIAMAFFGPGQGLSLLGGSVYMGGSFGISAAVAGFVLAKLVKTVVPVWWAFGLGASLALIWVGVNIWNSGYSNIEPGVLFGFGILPPVAMVVGSTSGALLHKKYRAQVESADA